MDILRLVHCILFAPILPATPFKPETSILLMDKIVTSWTIINTPSLLYGYMYINVFKCSVVNSPKQSRWSQQSPYSGGFSPFSPLHSTFGSLTPFIPPLSLSFLPLAPTPSFTPSLRPSIPSGSLIPQ